MNTKVQEKAASEDLNPASTALKGVRWVVAEVHWTLRVLISSADRFYWDDGFSKAAALAYSSLLSLVPLVALCFGILTSFAVSNEFIPQVREFLFRQFIPSEVNKEYVDTALNYVAQFSEALASLNAVVVCFLVLTALLLVNAIEYSLNTTWQVYQSRPISQRIAIFSSIILIGPILLFSAYYFADFRVQAILAEFEHGGVIYAVYKDLLPFFIDFSAFLFLYYLVPKAPVKLRSAIFGAAVAALLFSFAKGLFAYYLADFSSYDKVYKALSAIAVIPISLFWLYLAWSIVLFGAECSYQAQYLPRNGKLWKRSVLSVGDARMLLAVQSLVHVAHSFASGSKLPNDLELAELLGCSSVVLKPTLDALEKAGLIARGDSRDMPLILLKSPEQLSLGEVRQALFGDRRSLHFPREMERLFGFLKEPSSLNKTTLADIVRAEGQ